MYVQKYAKVYYLGTLGPLSRSNKDKYWTSSNNEYAIWFDAGWAEANFRWVCGTK